MTQTKITDHFEKSVWQPRGRAKAPPPYSALPTIDLGLPLVGETVDACDASSHIVLLSTTN